MEKPKILIFSTAYFPFVGGAEVAVKEITDRLPGFEFDLITARFDKKLPFREKIGNIMVYRLGIGIPLIDKLILPFEGALFVRHLSKKKKYNAFWGIMATFSTGAGYIFNIFSSQKVPIILNLQEGDSEEHFKTRWFGLIDLSWKMALKRTSYLTVLSNYLKERAQRLGYRGEVEIVPNGVDINNFQSSNLNSQGKQKIRESWGVKEDDILLITTSRLVKKNGIGDVIKALPKLDDKIKFMICGIGELKKELEDLARNIDVSHRVFFLGNVSHDQLPRYLKASDIFIRPSLSEGFGNSFIEAMASKLPVIATPVGGIADFLKEGETGYLCKPEDSESVAEAINKVLNDQEVKNGITESAYKMVKEKYDWNIIAGQMGKVLNNLINKKYEK